MTTNEQLRDKYSALAGSLDAETRQRVERMEHAERSARGWPEVPPAVKLATLIQASRLYSRRHAPFGIAGNLDVGEMRLLERLDVDLLTSVRPYVRVWGAV